MCKFCELNGLSDSKIISDNVLYLGDLGKVSVHLIMKAKDNKFSLFQGFAVIPNKELYPNATVDDWLMNGTQTQIEYCPFCGKKL